MADSAPSPSNRGDERSQRHVLYMQTRNLGDAVIGTSMIETIGRSNPDLKISVLTRPQFAEIYERNPFVSGTYYASFPMGTVKNFNFNAALSLFVVILKLRRKSFSAVLQASGDFRENLVAWLISPSNNIGPIWEEGHPLGKLCWPGLTSFVGQAVPIRAAEHNIYGVMSRLAVRLGPISPHKSQLYDFEGSPYRHNATSDAIGIHPMASQECKLWSTDKWRQLVMTIRASGLRVAIFGSSADRPYLRSCVPNEDDPGVEILTGSLADFFRGVANVRALVGLDSFGMHAAYAIGTPIVMINGGNIPTVWAPPFAEIVGSASPPSCYPCLNRPTCMNLPDPYHCIRDISAEQVVQSLRKLSAFA